MKRFPCLRLALLSCILHFSWFAQSQSGVPDSIIYRKDTIVWFGVDFSFLRLSNEKKIGDEEIVETYLPVWLDEHNKAFPNVKLASMLGKKKVINDKEYTSRAYTTLMPNQWIISKRHTISEDDIAEHIRDFESENHGLGLVYVVENFFKGLSGPGDPLPSKVYGYFVWFDIDSKKIIYTHVIQGTPSTAYYNGYGVIGNRKGVPKDKGMVGYWVQGLIDATVAFTIDYKKGIPVQETQY